MKHRIYVVGIGPGSLQGMTLQAREILDGCDCIVGYDTYIDLIRHYFPDKEFVTTGMTKEVERCHGVRDRAKQGQTVAIVSSGDAGIYGMAGIMHEVAADDDVDIVVIPGVTAASAGAALLGAPLVADTCLISLSDLLTPWEKIANRLDCAAAGDFVICLYNPASKKRADYLEKACDIILRHQPADTPAGIVRNIGREGQEVTVLTLGELRKMRLDIFCTVFIGNSQTRTIHGKLVTADITARSPVWIAGGTTEGRKLAHYADCCLASEHVSVATDYGASLVPESPFVTVVTGRMDEGEMETFLREQAIAQVIDATHPYATVVTANIRQACAAVGVPYRRIQRRRGRYEDQVGCIAVHSVGEAVEVLNHTTGPIFLTTGSKDLDSFAQIPDYAQRIYARILPVRPSLDRALDLGYLPAHGFVCRAPSRPNSMRPAPPDRRSPVVTKNSGHTGGFQEEIEAARQTGATVIVIERGE